MATYLLVLLLVIVFGLAWGALVTLMLREIHIRHPLPLGGTIGARKPSKTKSTITGNADTEKADAETPEVAETAHESVVADSFSNTEIGNILSPGDPSIEPPSEGQDAMPVDASVFDGTESIPENLPINDTLEAMIAQTSQTLPDDFERIIEESAKPDEEIRALTDNLDLDDLRALDEALGGAQPGKKFDFSQELGAQPGKKIDFSQELDESVDAVSSTAKEVLGEDFDFDALEKQAEQVRQSLQPLALDVLEDESGTVQVSSPFMAYVPQLADISLPQTILPTFSSDWIQESGGTSEPLEGDPALFCFTEESRPMFVRKKKSVGG